MKTISIRELHTRTGHYVRSAARQPIAVTERGTPIARLVPVTESTPPPRFRDRPLRPGFKRLLARSHAGTDSGQIISEDRER
jgi:prevent-host-death family protein